ncbi:hypothetical protein IM792_07130 [Mucilaginibacter sp. JRF]|uniref:hypothetical protein n=1 Tax=Mucilaginibacter sp. JRF TaxID=2780088 RepID=UPI001880853D|nr:hypothetical protein [Mucilaginibacter sp. JRF]MBE9584216.1 hypothetical protein [Mucilaginibacter sp. JRF]
MGTNKFTHLFFSILLLVSAVISSCRKDEDVQSFNKDGKDSTALSSSSGSFIATTGELSITFNDSTYVFDAETDSIAFVRVDTAGNKYFGITAINDDHTMSFGISGLGEAVSKATTKVEGSQFLFNDEKVAPSYTLSKSAHELDLGKLSLKKYTNEKDDVAAKGTFTTFLASDTTKDAVLYKVTGKFDIKFK